MKFEARHIDEKSGKCLLCPHNCNLNNSTGICGVRYSENKKFYTSNYGEVSSLATDPIEKKPLYHFYPKQSILSVGTIGCNLKCPYCQNYSISQNIGRTTQYISPEDLINTAKEKNSFAIAYTYSEPIIWYEYVFDTAKIAHENSLKNVMVSNGMIGSEALKELSPFINAWNIDLKTFDENIFRKFHKGKLESVKESIKYLADKTHLEITTLLVTGINDDIDDFKNIVDFIADINNEIPLHISRYFPAYKYDSPATDMSLMAEAYKLAADKLKNVYCGNISGMNETQNTYCPKCYEELISRSYYNVEIKNLDGSKCGKCGTEVYGVFE